MPTSALHEVLVDLIRHCPALLADLGLLPGASAPRVAEATANQAMAAVRAADLALVVGTPPTLAVVVEIQLRRDRHKRFAWPLYQAALAARHRCPAALLVVTPDLGVAAWAREAIAFGLGTGELRPLVVGPAEIPKVKDPARARRKPEAAVLSALVHGNAPDGLPVLLAALEALQTLPLEAALSYHDAVMRRLDEQRREALEVTVDHSKYQFRSAWALEHINKGMVEGLAAGRAEEASRIALRLIVRRCGMLGPDIQERVSALPIEQLERLIDASLDFTTLADLEAWLATA